MPDIWRDAEPLAPEREQINAHDFFSYVLLLRAMRSRFEEEDAIVWFDDALFFLRGGYDFFCYLNLATSLTMRGRIFGGLNHARQPSQRLRTWLARILDEARARDSDGIDVFVAEEINSGSSVHRIMNVVTEALDDAPTGAPVTIDFSFFLACTDNAVFDIERFTREVETKRRVESGDIVVRNNFRLFQGPLLAYDAERYSGLRTLSRGADPEERYQPIRYRASTFHLTCPSTGEEPIWCAPGENDLDNFAGVLVLNLLGLGGTIPYDIMARRIAGQSCVECRELFAQLRGPGDLWRDRLL